MLVLTLIDIYDIYRTVQKFFKLWGMKNLVHVQSKWQSTRHVVMSSSHMLKSSAHPQSHASPPLLLNLITFLMGRRTASATDVGLLQLGGPHIITILLACTVLPM